MTATRPLARARTLSWALLLCVLPASPVPGQQDTDEYFAQNCTSCHTIGGGRLTGPDLKNVAERKDREWLVGFIMDPASYLQRGDSYALKLKEESRGVVMPKPPGITRKRAEKLLDLIAEESQLERSRYAGVSLSDRPFVPEDLQRGRALFTGRERLTNGGPSCISCHSINSVGGLGGGRLGPDLSRAYLRLDGRKALGAWLASPPSETMSPVYKQHPLDSGEILPLLAFLKDAAAEDREAGNEGQINFLLLGIAGAAGMLLLFDVIWKRRFTGVRSRLIRGGR